MAAHQTPNRLRPEEPSLMTAAAEDAEVIGEDGAATIGVEGQVVAVAEVARDEYLLNRQADSTEENLR
jgi:hypothetical protein